MKKKTVLHNFELTRDRADTRFKLAGGESK